MQADCIEIINFYNKNNLEVKNENCCQWQNIQCTVDNKNIKTFSYVDDKNIKIDFTNFPVFEELSELVIQGKYLLGGSVPYNFFNQPKLTKLILDNSNIWEIPNLINSSSFSTIEILSLKSNLLSTFPYHLYNMPKLKNLIISDNKISGSLQEEIKLFPVLESLNLSKNFMTGSVPDLPHNLKELNIDDNQFKSLSFSSTQTPNLEIFTGNNNILDNSSFQLLTEFSNLRNISLENTGLTEVPTSINSLQNLKYLSLKNNGIEKLPDEFEGLDSLEELNLSGNKNLKAKIKGNIEIQECYINHTNVCLESENICKHVDKNNICGQSEGLSKLTLTDILIIVLIGLIITFVCYIVYYLFKFKKENDRMKKYSYDSTMESGKMADSSTNGSQQIELGDRTSKDVINSINQAVSVSRYNTQNDTKVRNAEIAFSNGLKIVGTADEAVNLANNHQKHKLKEIFKTIDDSFDEDISEYLSNIDNRSSNNNPNSINNVIFDDNTIPSPNRSILSNSSNNIPSPNRSVVSNSSNNIPSPNRSVISNSSNNVPSPCASLDQISPQLTDYSKPGSNGQIMMKNNEMNSNLVTQNNLVMNNDTINFKNEIPNNNNNNNNIDISNTLKSFELKPLQPRTLPTNYGNIINNNADNLKMNSRDNILSNILQDYSNENTNKISSASTNKVSPIYTNGLLNNNNIGLKLENYQIIANNNKNNINGSNIIFAANGNGYINNNPNQHLLTYPVYYLNVNTNMNNLKINSLANQNKTININKSDNNILSKKEPLRLIPIQSLNNVYVVNKQENIASKIPNSVTGPSSSKIENNTVASKIPNSVTGPSSSKIENNTKASKIPNSIIDPSSSKNENNSITSLTSFIANSINDTSSSRNSSLSQASNSFNENNLNINKSLTISLSSSSSNLSTSSFSDDESSKNIMFQNPTTTSSTIYKSSSINTKGYTSNLKPIFSHKNSIKSVDDISNNSLSNISIDSDEIEEMLKEVSK